MDMVDSFACSQMDSIFDQHPTIISNNGLPWVIEEQLKPIVNTFLSAIRPTNFRDRLRTDLYFCIEIWKIISRCLRYMPFGFQIPSSLLIWPTEIRYKKITREHAVLLWIKEWFGIQNFNWKNGREECVDLWTTYVSFFGFYSKGNRLLVMDCTKATEEQRVALF